MSNAEEDHDRKTIGDKVYYIKPKSLYPDRDDGRERQPAEGDDDRTQSRVRGKFIRKVLEFKLTVSFEFHQPPNRGPRSLKKMAASHLAVQSQKKRRRLRATS